MSTHLPLWRRARDFITHLFDIFGAPVDVAALVIVQIEAYRRLAHWISTAEAIMRRLILIEALALPRPNLAPVRPRRSARRRRRVSAFDPHDATGWRVSFRVFRAWTEPHASAAPANEAPATSTPRRYPTMTRPLALRFEALIRAFNDPAPYARRLARTLYRDAARAYTLVRTLPTPREPAADDLLADLAEAIAPGAARLVLNTS